jgi:anti-sigma factor RsiW
MSDSWTERLSEYIDDELSPRERNALETHLAGCQECGGLVDALRAVVARAADLPAEEPATDLWTAIRARIGGDVRVLPLNPPAAADRARRFAFSIPQLAAAAAIVAFLSGGAVWLAVRNGPGEPAFVVNDSPLPAAESAVQFAATPYDVAIDQLERELAAARERLDPATIAVIERNLNVIDAAIVEARRALVGDPANPYLNRHLDNTLMTKIEVLRRVTSIGRGRT